MFLRTVLLVSKHLRCGGTTCTSIRALSQSTSCANQQPKTLLDLYQKNESWIGMDYRTLSPSEGGMLEKGKLDELLRTERQKLDTGYKFAKVKPKPWVMESRRAGAIGIILGNSYLWRKDGERKFECTVVQIKDCQVIDTQLSIADGGSDAWTQMILGAVDENLEGLSGCTDKRFEWFHQRGIFPKRKWSGFVCTKDALMPVGTQITAGHFLPGQNVRCKLVGIDYGFQGVMKRWGMKGQRASHGVTKTHRKMGATGGGQDPGRVWPGKKMPGQMGAKYMSYGPTQVLRINTKYNIVYLDGVLPGYVGGFVKLRDVHTPNKPGFKPDSPPPFPTIDPQAELPEELFADNVYNFDDTS